MFASTQTNHPLTGVDETTAKLSRKGVLDAAVNRLRGAGLRITQPRISILETLLKVGRPASIEQIHDSLKPSSCDLVTVYRCLGAFEQLGLVRRSFLPNGTALYEMHLGGDHRYHVICKESKAVEEIDAETAAELRSAIQRVERTLQERGYADVSHVVEFFGVAGPKPRGAANVTIARARS
jgi:Fur family ferric uptake transcriptional regulator